MNQTVYSLFDKVIQLVNVLIYLLISLALVGFLWGVVRFLASGSNEKLKTEGRQFMLYGILSLFVMTSMWAIIYLMKDFLIADITVNQNYANDNNYTTDTENYRFDSEYNTQGSTYETFESLDNY